MEMMLLYQVFTLLEKPLVYLVRLHFSCFDLSRTHFNLFLVHGANRLGANSLLDIVVFGRACAHHISANLKPGMPHKKISEDAGMDSIRSLDEIRTSDGPRHTSEIRLDMQKAMQVRTPL